jgi:hypothetical protein
VVNDDIKIIESLIDTVREHIDNSHVQSVKVELKWQMICAGCNYDVKPDITIEVQKKD